MLWFRPDTWVTEVWSADFKGHFKTGDGRCGYPLTITDGDSRFLLACQALSSTRVQEAKPVFTRGFTACASVPARKTNTTMPLLSPFLIRAPLLAIGMKVR